MLLYAPQKVTHTWNIYQHTKYQGIIKSLHATSDKFYVKERRTFVMHRKKDVHFLRR